MKRITLAAVACLGFTLFPVHNGGQTIRSQIAKDLISKDSTLVDVYESEAKVAELLDVKQIDLNGDKKPEYLVSGVLCGAQNCSYWIYQKQGNRLVNVPTEIEGIFVRALTTRSKGWKDMVFVYHSSATREPRTVFRFNGRGYVAR